MGAIQLQSAAFPRTLQREAESLSRESDSELQASGLRSLAARLEQRRPELSIQIYGLLADSPTTPENHRQVARERFSALQGQGQGGARWEALIGRFLPEATDYRMIVPMLVASSVAGLVRAAALGRLSTGAASWFSRGLGLRAGSGGLAFAAEVPAFALSGRALQAGSGHPSEAPLGRDLAAAALSLGCLKGFVGLGAKLAPGTAWNAAVFAPAGLYTAHGIEERIGWRAPSDSTSRAVDAIAASLSLGIGARLGREVLGEGFHRRLSETSMRAELAQTRPRGESRLSWMTQPMLMAAESGDGKPPGPIVPPRPIEMLAARHAQSRDLKKYREILGLTLMGDPLHNIEARLAASTQLVRVLDLNSGNGEALNELKGRFGDRVLVETVRNHHESGDFLQADFKGQRFDLILSLLGQPVAEGQLVPILQKAVDHLSPGGELAVAMGPNQLRHPDSMAWKKFEELPKIRVGLQQGLALRSEKSAGNYLFYAQRLGSRGEVSLEKVLNSPPLAAPAASTLAYMESGLEAQTMSGAGRTWRLERSSASKMALCLLELGAQDALVTWPNLPQLLLNRFMAAFEKSHHRPPAAHEIQHWIDGREPSALHSKELFVDEWLQLQSQRARELSQPPPRIPGSLLAIGAGLSSFFGASRSWAGPLSEPIANSWELSPTAVFVTGLALLSSYGLFRLVRAFEAAKETKIPATVPPAWRFARPGNDNLRAFDDIEASRSEFGPDWTRPERWLKPGWIKEERKRIFAVL
ncbi:MAG TPA: class I SAM-dependent methyltransferase, partial [bacterium]|nr:class I SAM-dependent methyltransferase [bacterium]